MTKLPPTVEIRVHPDEEISTIVLDKHDRITYLTINSNKTQGTKQMSNEELKVVLQQMVNTAMSNGEKVDFRWVMEEFNKLCVEG